MLKFGTVPQPLWVVDDVHSGARSVVNPLMPAVKDQRVTPAPHVPPVPTVAVCHGRMTRTSSPRIDSVVLHSERLAGVKIGPPKCTEPTALPSADFTERSVQSAPPTPTNSVSFRSEPTPVASAPVHTPAPLPGASPRSWLALWATTTELVPIASSALPLTVADHPGAMVGAFATVTEVSSRFHPLRVAPCPAMGQAAHAVRTTTRTINGPKRRIMVEIPQLPEQAPKATRTGKAGQRVARLIRGGDGRSAEPS